MLMIYYNGGGVRNYASKGAGEDDDVREKEGAALFGKRGGG